MGEGKTDVLDLMLVPGIRGGTVRRLLADKRREGWTWEGFWTASEEGLRQKFGLSPESARIIARQREWLVSERERIVKRLLSINADLVSWDDPIYPAELRLMKDPPPLLFWKGNWELLSRRKVGVLSSRNPSWRDVALVGRMILSLRETGAVVVSGAGAIQHYVPGYWGLLAEVPVIWVLDRGLLSALEAGAQGHIAPFARMDGRLWREEWELAVSAFSPEDVGTPGGMRLRDRILAYLSNDLAGWGIREGGNAMRVLLEKYEAGARVVIAVRKPAPSHAKQAQGPIPRLVVDESIKNWRQWLLKTTQCHPEFDENLIHYVRLALSEPATIVLFDFHLNADELGVIAGQGEDLRGALWMRGGTDARLDVCRICRRKDALRLDESDEMELRRAKKILLVTGWWDESIEICDVDEEEMQRWEEFLTGEVRRIGEPVRDYRPQSPAEYRRAHKKLLEVWRREVLGKVPTSREKTVMPRAVVVAGRVESQIPPAAEFVWICPSAGQPAWLDKIATGFGLMKADGMKEFEGWEIRARIVRFLAKS
jgi:hypothetical protein